MELRNTYKGAVISGLLMAIVSGSAFGASLSDLSKSGLSVAAQSTGCGLIPFPDLKVKCIDGNARLHTAQACDASSCKQSTGDKNPAYQEAAQNCVEKRTSVESAFATTESLLNRFLQRTSKTNDRNTKAMKVSVRKILGEIAAGKPEHAKKLREAKLKLANCKTF